MSLTNVMNGDSMNWNRTSDDVMMNDATSDVPTSRGVNGGVRNCDVKNDDALER